MNISRFAKFFLLLPFIWHLVLIFGGIYFLSPEISVYPYLVSRGLLPYLNIIDQHLPLLFFGPLNLAQLGLTAPQAALPLFAIVLLLTDLGFLLALKKKVGGSLKISLLLTVFVNLQIILAGYHFWIESFVLLFLVWGIYLLTTKKKRLLNLGILFFSLVLGLRPQLGPFLLVLLWSLNFLTLSSLTALSLIPLLQLTWLIKHQLLDEFITIFRFNHSFYLSLASRLPTLAEIIRIGFSFLSILVYHSRLKIVTLFFLASLAAYPRFELYHLLPSLSLLALPSSYKPKNNLLIFLFLFTSFIAIYLRRPFKPTNFYYPNSLAKISNELRTTNYELRTIYFFGGPDQLYPLTDSLPPDNFYLPPLPWYLANPQFVTQQIQALQNNPSSLIAINRDSQLNGVSLLDYGQPIWKYIQDHYKQIDSLDNLNIYKLRFD